MRPTFPSLWQASQRCQEVMVTDLAMEQIALLPRNPGLDAVGGNRITDPMPKSPNLRRYLQGSCDLPGSHGRGRLPEHVLDNHYDALQAGIATLASLSPLGHCNPFVKPLIYANQRRKLLVYVRVRFSQDYTEGFGQEEPNEHLLM